MLKTCLQNHIFKFLPLQIPIYTHIHTGTGWSLGQEKASHSLPYYPCNRGFLIPFGMDSCGLNEHLYSHDEILRIQFGIIFGILSHLLNNN